MGNRGFALFSVPIYTKVNTKPKPVTGSMKIRDSCEKFPFLFFKKII
jgi:hypothetical protein